MAGSGGGREPVLLMAVCILLHQAYHKTAHWQTSEKHLVLDITHLSLRAPAGQVGLEPLTPIESKVKFNSFFFFVDHKIEVST